MCLQSGWELAGFGWPQLRWLVSVFCGLVQQASLGLFSWWKQSSKRWGGSPQDLLRPGLGTGPPSLPLHSGGQPAPRSGETHSLLEGQKSHIATCINMESSFIGATDAVNPPESNLPIADVHAPGRQRQETMKSIQPLGSWEEEGLHDFLSQCETMTLTLYPSRWMHLQLSLGNDCATFFF